MNYVKKRQQQRQEFFDNLMESNAKMKKAIESFLSDYDNPKTNPNDIGSLIEALRETIK